MKPSLTARRLASRLAIDLTLRNRTFREEHPNAPEPFEPLDRSAVGRFARNIQAIMDERRPLNRREERDTWMMQW